MPNPMYSPHLQYAPTFRWGGREWGSGDQATFEKFLRKRGINPQRWYKNHRVAAKTFDPVEGQIYSLFQPQLTGIDFERKQRQDYFKRLMGDLGSFTTSVMGMLGGIAPAIGGAYREGAETMDAAGRGLGSVLNNQTAEAAAAANEVLSSIGAPEGQMLEGGDAGGALAGLAGWIPAAMLNQQGGAFSAAASQLPKTASIESQLTMKDLLRQASEEDDEFSNQILQLLQGLPGARQDLSNQSFDRRMDEREFALDALKAERDWAMKEAYLAMSQGDRKRAEEYLKIAREREQRMQAEQYGVGPSGQPLPGYYRDNQGRIVPKGYRYNNKGELVSGSSGGRGGTWAERHPKQADVKAVSQIQDDIDRYVKSLVKENPEPPFNEIVPDYQEAFEQLWNRFKNNVKTAAGRKALKQAIASALRSAGIKRAPAPSQPGPK